MTAPTVEVTAKLSSFGGPALAGVVITATADKDDNYQGLILRKTVTATTDTNGEAVFNLFPNALATAALPGLGTTGSTYRFTASVPNGWRMDVRAQVPNTACDLHSIVMADDADLPTPGEVAGAVRYDIAQTLTSPQQAQARANIGFDAAVRAVALTGLSLATATAVTAADTVLVALGKAQAQITALDTAKANLSGAAFSGAVSAPSFVGPLTGDVSGNAGTVTNGVYTTGSYANPAWITSLAGSKISGDISGNAATATALATPRTINGTSFNGSADITITAAAGTLTGTTLAANVTSASLDSITPPWWGLSVTGIQTITANSWTPALVVTQNGSGYALTVSGAASFGGAVSATSFTGPLTGNASTATALATARNINGVSFNGSADITITAAAGTLTGTTLAANVVNASLNSITPTGGILSIDGNLLLGTTSAASFTGAGGIGVSRSSLPAIFLENTGTGAQAFMTYVSTDSSYRLYNSTTHSDLLLVSASGDLLINQTTNPSSYKLAVTGNVGVTGSISATTNLTLGNGTGIPSAAINGAASGTNGGASLVVQTAGNSLIGLGNKSALLGGAYDATPMLYGNAPIEVNQSLSVTGAISTTGNIGLGVSPYAWGGGYKSLDVLTYGSLALAGGTFQMLNNAYFNGTDYIYKNTAAATDYVHTAGTHGWRIAPSGTAGSAVTFSTAMSLDSAGLTVTGSISATGGATINSITPTGGLLAVTGSMSATNGSISATATGETFISTAATTSPRSLHLANTGGDVYFGIEGSSSGGFFTGSTAYATVVYSTQRVQTIISGVKRTEVDSAGLTVTGSISATTEIQPKATPNLDWGINFAESTAVPNCITLPNGDTYDLVAGSGLVVLHSNTTGSIGVFAVAGGVTTVISDPSAQYSVASGTATKINVYYNGTDKYRIQNLTGGSVTLFIAGIKTRTAT